jgi:hypothetical protein
MSFICSGEDSGAWGYQKKQGSNVFVWPYVDMPVEITVMESAKMLIALFYR